MSEPSETILLVEDNPDDVFAMRRALHRARIDRPMQIVTDGREAIDYFSGEGKFHDRELFPLPAITFLDLKLPYLSGFQVLRWIREHLVFRELLVVVLTSSDEERDVRRATTLGVHTYMVKPPTPDRLKALLLPASGANVPSLNCRV